MTEPILPVEQIEPASDAVGSDADSSYDERSLSTASVTSSIYEYQRENGRTYHAYKQERGYSLPNDEAEQQRMDIQFHAFRLAYDDKTSFAPLENPRAVIDVGTGTGVWAMDYAEEHPSAEVIGVDLSPIQPGFMPNNCSFQVMDVEEDWDMPNRFDLIHARDMNGYIRNDRNLYRLAFDSLKPGGWIELQEFDFFVSTDDNSLPENSAIIKWQTLWQEGIAKNNMSKRYIPGEKKKQLEEAGFTDVVVHSFKMPLGPWPKDARLKQSGQFNLVGLLDGIAGISLRVFTQLLGWTVEDLDVLLTDVRKELKNKKVHCYVPLYAICGQKPNAS